MAAVSGLIRAAGTLSAGNPRPRRPSASALAQGPGSAETRASFAASVMTEVPLLAAPSAPARRHRQEGRYQACPPAPDASPPAFRAARRFGNSPPAFPAYLAA